MGKKLVTGPYTFNATDGVVTIPQNVHAEQLLLITDVAINKFIYNFADPGLGYESFSYDVVSNTTTIQLSADLVAIGCADDDELQIFYDYEHTEVSFSETFIDPVSKIRVSTPENLIDTDFEYGTQSSKWETLQTVNNIPTIYSTTGDIPISGITSVRSTEGSKQIRVLTNTPHGLELGDPINAQGLTEYLAEGYFLVSGVSSSREFFYEMDSSLAESKELSGSYTTIIPSKFFEGSNLILDEASGDPIVTDEGSPSILTLKTEYTHGFEENTKMYLRNTVGPKNLIISDQTVLAPDGRPVVDTTDRIENTFTIDSTAGTGRGGIAEYPVSSMDWTSTYVQYFNGSEFDVTANTISWTGHGLSNNFCLLANYPIQGTIQGGIQDGTVYYVKVVDENTIQLCTDYGSLSNIVDITANPGISRGQLSLSLVYKVERKEGNVRATPYYTRNQSTVSARADYSRSGTGNYRVTLPLPNSITGSVSKIILDRVYASGDINSSREYINMIIYGKDYLGLGGSSYGLRLGGRNRSTENYYPNVDLTRCLIRSGDSYSFDVTYDPTSSVGGTWRVYLYLTAYSIANPADSEHSGYDLTTTVWGLGGSQPERIIAFQNRTQGGSFTSADGFSNLANQREKARYTTSNPVYNYPPNTYDSLDGKFSLNYNDGTDNLGENSEIFYAFANTNTAYRNTFYYPGHNLEDGADVELTASNYSTSQKESFRMVSGNGDLADHQETLIGKASVVSPSEFRVESTDSPNTTDVAVYPSEMTVTQGTPNEFYNTIYVPNHKVVSSVPATYTNISGDPIGGLVDGNPYQLSRFNDSRLFINLETVTEAASADTAIIGANVASPVNFDIDIETPLEITAPTTATITEVWYRGDFNDQNEFVTITLEDGYTFDVGVRGARSNVWQRDDTWSPKDISSVLKDIGAGIQGFTVTADATNNTVNGKYFREVGPYPGMNNYWEIYFVVNGQAGTVNVLNPGTGSSSFAAQSIVGAYDGIFDVTDVPLSNSMTLETDFEIPVRNYDFTGVEINAGTNVISLGSIHNLVTGEKLNYTALNGATEMYDTVATTEIFAIVINTTEIALAQSYTDAVNGSRLPISAEAGDHRISTANIVKSVLGNGTVSTSTINGLYVIEGNGTTFLSDYKRLDEFWVICQGFMQKFIVNKVLTNERMELREPVPQAIVDSDYFFTTQAIPRPDGYSLHKPFDGGIDITAGTSPNCRVTRQTRKYFRYQSGKGIQNSFAINFSPTKILNSLIADGTTIIANTQTLHNLSVGEQIQIFDAEISIGEDEYTGIHTITSVPSPYEFQYTVDNAPLQTKAAGTPSFNRLNWRDSYVRAGMFDDQNGFFLEYDGTDIHCVRRSSTLQLSGVVNTEQGSQVITGSNTSFTTQLDYGNNIVVRGQTYRVVEVSSDRRLVVQPAYKGISASNVKLTKTVDVRVKQADWSIDPCDGSGPHGYVLDINKIQMCYADYSWYGAGKIRFGFKDQNGHVKYVHEFIHNNKLLESYFRSGNLPGRYEIENGSSPNTAPTLFHFGTSVIMDGTFDDDKAYLFSSSSNPFAFTNGSSSTFTSSANTIFEQITLNNQRVYVYAIPVSESVAQSQTVGTLIRDDSNTNIPEGTYIAQVVVNGTDSKVYTSFPGTTVDPDNATIATGATFTIGETTPIDLTRPIPLVSLRLAPSVDSGVTGAVGERDIINRMQLTLRRAGITTNQDLEAYVILNGLPSNLNFEKVQSPSLSEIIRHDPADEIQQGTIVYSTKISVGSMDIELGELIDMGNSILGGDSIFPSGPDLITIAIQPQDTSTISGAAPLFVSGKITWTESQA